MIIHYIYNSLVSYNLWWYIFKNIRSNKSEVYRVPVPSVALVYGSQLFFILKPLVYGSTAGIDTKPREEMQRTTQSYENILSNGNILNCLYLAGH
jgi:hypothetical protein